MPLTATEWWISTTAMLLAGILWAYVIGKFTNSTERRRRNLRFS